MRTRYLNGHTHERMDQAVPERTLDDIIDELISAVPDDVAGLMEKVIERELHDQYNPQATTPQDYAVMAWELKNSKTEGREG